MSRMGTSMGTQRGTRLATALAIALCLAGTAAAQPVPPASDIVDTIDTRGGGGRSGPPLASLPLTPTEAPPLPLSKKARFLEQKHRAAPAASVDRQRWQAHLDQRIGKQPAPVVNIFNTWTHELLPVERAEQVDAAQRNRFFRCHFTNQPTSMDARLFAALVAAARHFGAERIDIVSGYRAPKYNLMLRKKGREVARKSQHTLGSAIDFRLPGVPVRRLHAWVRRLSLGGVGFYPSSGFIHMDTGPVRYWSGR